MTSPMTLLGEAKETGDQLRDRVLALTTEFVRSRWYRMEVSTPLVGEHGRFSGGYHRLLATRKLWPASVDASIEKASADSPALQAKDDESIERQMIARIERGGFFTTK